MKDLTLVAGERSADVSRAQREPARPNPDELLTIR